MKPSDIKIIQHYLQKKSLYPGRLDGNRDKKTDKAIQTVLFNRAAELPTAWRTWSGRKKATACLQLICRDNNINAGPIDGLYGPQTESAAKQLKDLNTVGILPRGFGDIEVVKTNPHSFPLESETDLTEYYGEPCKAKLVKVPCPWELRLDWDLNTITRSILIHETLADSLARILDRVVAEYGSQGIKRYSLDRYGGSYNCRKKEAASLRGPLMPGGLPLTGFRQKTNSAGEVTGPAWLTPTWTPGGKSGKMKGG